MGFGDVRGHRIYGGFKSVAVPLFVTPREGRERTPIPRSLDGCAYFEEFLLDWIIAHDSTISCWGDLNEFALRQSACLPWLWIMTRLLSRSAP